MIDIFLKNWYSNIFDLLANIRIDSKNTRCVRTAKFFFNVY